MINYKKAGDFVSSGCIFVFFALLTVKLLNVGAIGELSWWWVFAPMIFYVIILVFGLSVIGALTIYNVNKKVSKKNDK